jgi:hypothetical protein
MNKVRRLITLFVILISLIIIDEGKAIMLGSNDIQFHLSQDQTNEIEIPYQYCFNGTDYDITWIRSNTIEPGCLSGKLIVYSNFSTKMAVDFAGFVWQPPESV